MTAQRQFQVSPRLQRLPLQQLLAARADLWQGRVASGALTAGIPTGFAALDQCLPWGGWPSDGLTEILTDQPGAGLALILPALARLCAGRAVEQAGPADQDVGQNRPPQARAIDDWSPAAGPSAEPPVRRPARRSAGPPVKPPAKPPAKPLKGPARAGWLLLVNPPLIPYAPALEAEGIGLGDLVVVEAPGQGAWAMEQGLRLGGCAAVIAWSAGLTEHRRLQQDAAWSLPVLRRLQLAAHTQVTPAFLLRPASAAGQSSPAQLRVDCVTSRQGLELHLRKLRGGRSGVHLKLSGLHDESLAVTP
jgi:hypothetical protein